MPIMICRNEIESQDWEIMRTIPLGGNKNGLIHKNWIRNQRPIKSVWHISVADLLEETEYSAENHTIASNLKPTDPTEIVYIRLTDIWAYVDGDIETKNVGWVPLMLRFHEWYTVKKDECDDFEGLKKQTVFSPNIDEQTGVSYEFLYLKGDSSKQPWTWSISGGLNGALLYSPVRQLFIEKMKESGGLSPIV
jgi:hypothetical protein